MTFSDKTDCKEGMSDVDFWSQQTEVAKIFLRGSRCKNKCNCPPLSEEHQTLWEYVKLLQNMTLFRHLILTLVIYLLEFYFI